MFRTERNFSTKLKNSLPVPYMTLFEQLLFCSGGTYYITYKDADRLSQYTNAC